MMSFKKLPKIETVRETEDMKIDRWEKEGKVWYTATKYTDGWKTCLLTAVCKHIVWAVKAATLEEVEAMVAEKEGVKAEAAEVAEDTEEKVEEVAAEVEEAAEYEYTEDDREEIAAGLDLPAKRGEVKVQTVGEYIYVRFIGADGKMHGDRARTAEALVAQLAAEKASYDSYGVADMHRELAEDYAAAIEAVKAYRG